MIYEKMDLAVDVNRLCCTPVFYSDMNIYYGEVMSGGVPLIVGHRANSLLPLK